MNFFRVFIVVMVGGLVLVAYGCSDLSYYLHCARGQYDIIAKRRPVSDVLNDPATPSQLRQQLSLSQEIRSFASSELGLPDNDSYRTYSDLGRPYVVWNVVATPEYSLAPVTWCFPIAGCVPYRGYYQKEEAEKFAGKLKAEGYDTWVYGVPAYSTLNWFADPVLNTFSHYPESALAAMIFHELAHQKVYLQGDAEFNESFAETIEEIGVHRWLNSRQRPDLITSYEQFVHEQQLFNEFARNIRADLLLLYETSADPARLRMEKMHILMKFKQGLQDLRAEHPGMSRYRSWLGDEVNNAWFASLNTYRNLVPAFANLYNLKQQDLQLFYAEVGRIAGLERDERRAVLSHLTNTRVARAAQFQNPSPPSAPLSN